MLFFSYYHFLFIATVPHRYVVMPHFLSLMLMMAHQMGVCEGVLKQSCYCVNGTTFYRPLK